MSDPATLRFVVAMEALHRCRHAVLVVLIAALVVTLTESALLKNPVAWLLVLLLLVLLVAPRASRAMRAGGRVRLSSYGPVALLPPALFVAGATLGLLAAIGILGFAAGMAALACIAVGVALLPLGRRVGPVTERDTSAR